MPVLYEIGPMLQPKGSVEYIEFLWVNSMQSKSFEWKFVNLKMSISILSIGTSLRPITHYACFRVFASIFSCFCVFTSFLQYLPWFQNDTKTQKPVNLCLKKTVVYNRPVTHNACFQIFPSFLGVFTLFTSFSQLLVWCNQGK